jgi:site-specific DNA-adenine methylase
MKYFLFGRLGNKTNEIKNFKMHFPNIDSITTVVEPFGGSFAVIRCHYINEKKKFHVNDTDDKLFDVYKNYIKYGELTNQLAEITDTCLNDNNNIDYRMFLEEVKKSNIDLNSNLYKFWINTKLIKGRYLTNCIKRDFTDSYEIMKKINFTCVDYKDVFLKYQKDKKAFLFVDPPYLFSDNSSYNPCNDDEDTTSIIVFLKNFLEDKKTKCKVMIIVNELAILRDIFSKFYKSSYGKTYGISRKKMKHMIITNY